MPGTLLLEEMERVDQVAESLERVEDALREDFDTEKDLEKAEEALRNAAQAAERIAQAMKGMALAYENEWRKIVRNVAKGQAAEMQAERAGLLSTLEKRLGFAKQTHALFTRLHRRGRTDLDPDFLLPEIAGMERLKARVFDRWQSEEDLEDLAARDYPLTTAELDQIGPQRHPPDSWYAEENKPF